MMTMKKKKKNQISSTSLLRDDHDYDQISISISISSSSSSPTPNREAVYLTEDLILEIFTHLPPASLLRFKSVSKSLHSQISNPDFLRRNAVHQFRGRQDPSPPPPPPGILFRLGQELSGDSTILINSPSTLHSDGDLGHNYYYSQLLQILIDYRPEHDQPAHGNEKVKFTVIDSCNGLLLYLNCVRHQNPPGGKCIWYVCNPITKDYIKLPPLLEEQGIEIVYNSWELPPLEGQGIKMVYISWASLVFDPSLSLTYKVVIWLGEHGGAWKLYVYSSETRSWRLSVSLNINDFAFHVLQKQFNYFDFRAVLLNGVLYWSSVVANDMDVLLCYDVEKDSVWTLKFPKMPVEYHDRKLFYFGVCGGGLRLIEKYYNWSVGNTFPSSFDVMEMNQTQLQQQQQDSNIDDRDLWTVKYRINIGEDGSYYANLISGKRWYDVFILDLYKTTTTKAGGGEAEEMLLCTTNHNDLLFISFNLSDNTFGKELLNEVLLREPFLGVFTEVLRYTNITLFPLH